MPQLWVVAGPNGPGKTTFADRRLAPRIPVVSPDTISAAQGVGPIQAGRCAILEHDPVPDLVPQVEISGWGDSILRPRSSG